MKNKNYLIYNLGDAQLRSHVDAVHAQSPKSDKYTKEIVLGIIERTNASGIIATVSRTIMDINRPRNDKNAPAVDEYRKTISKIIRSKNILDENNMLTRNYLHLAIHGMTQSIHYNTDFEIGTCGGKSCSPQVVDWFTTQLQLLSTIGINNRFPGVKAKIDCHRNGDAQNYLGYGNGFNTIQVEISPSWRKNNQEELINFFSDIIRDFERTF